MVQLYITSIETEYDVHALGGDPKIFHARVYCESLNGVKLSFSTDTPAQYHVGDLIEMDWKFRPTV